MNGRVATGEEGWVVGDRVLHVMEQDGFQGTIRRVEDNRLSVMVEWDDVLGEVSFAWSNRLVLVER